MNNTVKTSSDSNDGVLPSPTRPLPISLLAQPQSWQRVLQSHQIINLNEYSSRTTTAYMPKLGDTVGDHPPVTISKYDC